MTREVIGYIVQRVSDAGQEPLVGPNGRLALFTTEAQARAVVEAHVKTMDPVDAVRYTWNVLKVEREQETYYRWDEEVSI